MVMFKKKRYILCVIVDLHTAGVALTSLTSDCLSLLGLKQRTKKGWQVDRAFMRESRDWRNWPLSVGTGLRLSVWACAGDGERRQHSDNSDTTGHHIDIFNLRNRKDLAYVAIRIWASHWWVYAACTRMELLGVMMTLLLFVILTPLVERSVSNIWRSSALVVLSIVLIMSKLKASLFFSRNPEWKKNKLN